MTAPAGAGSARGGSARVRNYEVYLGYACNRACRFCFVEKGDRGRFGRPPSAREVCAGLISAAGRGFNSLALLGGEPTLYPGLAGLVRAARRIGFKRVILFSNGMRLADRRFAAGLAAAGVDAVSLNLPSHLPDKFAHLTRREDGFELALRALANLSALRVPVAAVCVLNRLNFRDLPGYAEFYRDKGVRAFVLQHVKLQGSVNPSTNPGNPDIEKLKVKMSACVPAIRNMAERCLGIGMPPPFVEFLPPCLLPEMVSHLMDCRNAGRLAAKDFLCWHPGAGSEPTFEVAYKDRVKFPGCPACAYNGVCRGVDSNYVRVFGRREFKPVDRPPAQFAARLRGAGRRLAAAGFEAVMTAGRFGPPPAGPEAEK